MHYLNCGDIDGLKVCGEHLGCHCLVIETLARGLALVDTRLGAQDFGDPAKRLGLAFTYGFGRPRRDPALVAGAQIRARAHDLRDVRHIVLIHMEFGHVGGLVDFLHARVHVHAAGHAVATHPRGTNRRSRYKPVMWAHGLNFAPTLTKESGGSGLTRCAIWKTYRRRSC